MTVFVDDMRAGFGKMVMCHLIADTHEELLAMVDRIGVQRKWIQHAGNPQEHFDICLSKRKLAVAAGAVEIGYRACGAMTFRRQVEGILGKPEDAIDWRWAYRLAKSKGPATTNDGTAQ